MPLPAFGVSVSVIQTRLASHLFLLSGSPYTLSGLNAFETQFWFFYILKKNKSLKGFYTLTSVAYQIKSSPLSLSLQVLHDLALTHFWNVILRLFPFMDSMFSATPSQLGNLCLEYSSPSLPVKSLLILHGPGHKPSPTRSSLSRPNLHSILSFFCGLYHTLPCLAGDCVNS